MLMEGVGQGVDHVPDGGMDSESLAKDANLVWFQGELSAANAMIDELLIHIAQLPGSYMKKRHNDNFFPVTEAARELREAARKITEKNEGSGGSKESPKSSQAVQHRSQYMGICSNHDDCEARRAQINMTNKLKARELVRGHMANVVRGLKIYDNIFTAAELSKVTDYVNELRVAGRNGKLSGETFLMFNHLPTQQLKDVIKREFIQFGSPLYESAANQKKHLEPIPPALQDVIDYLVQWDLIPDSKKPNGCMINYLDEGEFSTLLLSKSQMAFGHNILVCDDDGLQRLAYAPVAGRISISDEG